MIDASRRGLHLAAIASMSAWHIARHRDRIAIHGEAGMRDGRKFWSQLRDAARHPPSKLDLDLARSLMIGDKPSDLEAGRAAGCCAVLGLGRDGMVDDARYYEHWSELARDLAREPSRGA